MYACVYEVKSLSREGEVAQSCPTLCDPMDSSQWGSSIHGVFQARVLEWGAIAFSIRPSLGIANYQLNNLFNTLKGDPDLNSPRSLSQEA